ncbi:MAG: nitrogen regulatory protein [Devosia sp.]|uniref:PTS sugar transporter subunit IIA n=1 Tax=Devosia sp. TaxID=1871048 RepID=UPI0026232168|nr:PTS sugar transporter subunit IIA [Devosia sp.]MDB5539719.1 nitrogen regulatory protein [Devosia sp.]
MELADILSEESVIVCSGIKTKLDVLQRLSERAASVTGQDAATIFEAVNDREQLGSTGLGNGIAIPHGKIPGIGAVTAVFARLETPVEFEAVDDQPVDLVMLLLAPMGAGADHLKALARVARILRTDSVTSRLRRSHDAAEMYAILTQPLQTTRAA